MLASRRAISVPASMPRMMVRVSVAPGRAADGRPACMLVLHDAKNACHEVSLTAGGPSRPGVRQSVAARVTLIDHHLVAVALHRALPIALPSHTKPVLLAVHPACATG